MRTGKVFAVALAAVTAMMSFNSWSQSEPPLRMIIAFAPGGSADAVGRAVAEGLAKRLGRPVVPENRPGATGTIGTNVVATAPGDGNTILMATSSSHYSAYLYPQVPYDLGRDLTAVASIAVVPLLVVARPGLPASSIPELVALAKKNPGQITYASPGSGGAAHLATEMFARATGIQMLHIPYKGVAAGVTDLMGERVDIMFDSISTSGPHVRARKLKALAISSAQRSPAMPEVPTISEAVPGFEATYWMGIFAPASTPAATVSRLNAEINAVLKDPQLQQRITDMGGVMRPADPKDFANYLTQDSVKWIKVIRDTGAKAD